MPSVEWILGFVVFVVGIGTATQGGTVWTAHLFPYAQSCQLGGGLRPHASHVRFIASGRSCSQVLVELRTWCVCQKKISRGVGARHGPGLSCRPVMASLACPTCLTFCHQGAAPTATKSLDRYCLLLGKKTQRFFSVLGRGPRQTMGK